MMVLDLMNKLGLLYKSQCKIKSHTLLERCFCMSKIANLCQPVSLGKNI